jgi:ATP-dependent Zn protease
MRKSTQKRMRADREAYLLQQQDEALQKDIFLAAVHEAGHALAYTLCGVGVEYATVERRTVEHDGQQMMSSGFTQPLPRPLSKETIEQEAICVLAGPAAEDAFNGSAPSGSQGDVDNVRNYAVAVGLSQDETVDLTSRAYRSACALVDKHIDALKQIAFELMTKGRIEGDIVRTIIERVKP